MKNHGKRIGLFVRYTNDPEAANIGKVDDWLLDMIGDSREKPFRHDTDALTSNTVLTAHANAICRP